MVEDQAGRDHFTLPSKLKATNAVINVDAEGECFKYALLSILHYNDLRKHQRPRKNSYRQWEGELKEVEGDAIRIGDIPNIERANNVKINVHVWSGNNLVGIRYNNPHVIAPRTINVLLIAKGVEYHYCGITSLRPEFNQVG